MAKEKTPPLIAGYKQETGIPIPLPNYGRKAHDESALVTEYIEGRTKGIYKNHSHGARELAKIADKHSGGKKTKEHRLRLKFGAAWKQHMSGENVTIK